MGVAVAVQASAHTHQHLARNLLHGLHLAVAGLAGDAGVDVRPVVEIDVVGQGVDPLPCEGLVGLERSGYLLDFRLIRASDAVSIHAGFQRGHARVPGSLGPRVAVETGDVIVACVQLVGERNGLFGRITRCKAVGLGGVTDRQHRAQHSDGSDG